MIQAVSLSRLDKYSFFSAVPQSWSFFTQIILVSASSLKRGWFCFMRLPGAMSDGFGLGGLENRTKSSKIGKMFYSCTFAKAVWSQITSKFQKERFARNRGQVQRLSSCRAALHLAKSLPFTDKSLKMGLLSVNGLLEKCRLRTKWSKTAFCP